jgi:hypothetical protein
MESNIDPLVDVYQKLDFEYILSHLGPSAAPLMSFFNKNDAANLLITNKYISSLVTVYNNRWGILAGAYHENSDFSFAIRNSNGIHYFPPLRPWQRLGHCKRSKWTLHFKQTHTHDIIICGNNSGSKKILSVTKDELKQIFCEVVPFIEARKIRLENEAIAAKLEEEKAEKEAERAAFIAKYTINVGPPPAVNPWGKKKIVSSSVI